MLNNQEQYCLLMKLQQYLTIVSKDRPTVYSTGDIEKLSKRLSKGVCSGLVALWLYYKYRSKEYYFYNTIMMPIFTWDGDPQKLSPELRESMEYTLSAVAWLQAGGLFLKQTLSASISSGALEDKASIQQSDYDLLINLIKQDDYPSLRKEYEIAFVFTKDEFADILKELPANKWIRISSDDHVIGLFCDGKNQEYILFDPNGFIVEKTEECFFEKRFFFNNIEKLIIDIYDIFLFVPNSQVLGLIVSVFDNIENGLPTYPDRVHSIKKILDKRLQNKEYIDIDAANFSDEASALYLAATLGHLDTVVFLLSKGARVNKASKLGYTALHSAAQQNQYGVVEELLKFSGIQQTIDISAHDGCTALYAAADSGCVETVQLLLRLGANATRAANDSWTPMHIASQEGHVKVVEALLFSEDRKKIINTVLPGGSTPLNIASKNNHLEIVNLLLNKGADLKKATNTLWSPFHTAAYAGYLGILTILLKFDKGKMLVNAPLLNGDTPVSLAAQNGHYAVVRFLLTQGAKLIDHCATWMRVFQEKENQIEQEQALQQAKCEVAKNWIDKDYVKLVQIRATYLLAKKRVDILAFEVQKISQELIAAKKFNKSSGCLESRWAKIARLEQIKKEVEHLKLCVYFKTYNIKVENVARREQLVFHSEKMFLNLLNKIKASGSHEISGQGEKMNQEKTIKRAEMEKKMEKKEIIFKIPIA